MYNVHHTTLYIDVYGLCKWHTQFASTKRFKSFFFSLFFLHILLASTLSLFNHLFSKLYHEISFEANYGKEKKTFNLLWKLHDDWIMFRWKTFTLIESDRIGSDVHKMHSQHLFGMKWSKFITAEKKIL